MIGCSCSSASRNRAPRASEYFVPSLKTWPTSMACRRASAAAAPRARVAVDGVAEVGEAVDLEVAVQIDARQVRVGLRWRRSRR